MNPLALLSTLIISAPGIAYAQQAEQSAYEKLAQGLHEEVQILSRICSAETAHEKLPALKQAVAALKSLQQETDSQQLWRYIENTQGLKEPLINAVELLFIELQRLEKARFYGVKELAQLLRPMLIPAS